MQHMDEENNIRPRHSLYDLLAKYVLICTYCVTLLEFHHELFVTLVWVEHLFLACVKQDLQVAKLV